MELVGIILGGFFVLIVGSSIVLGVKSVINNVKSKNKNENPKTW